MAIICSELKHTEGHAWIMTSILPSVSQFFSEATIANHCIYFQKFQMQTQVFMYLKDFIKNSFILKCKSPYNSSDLIIDGYKNTGVLRYDLLSRRGLPHLDKCPVRSSQRLSHFTSKGHPSSSGSLTSAMLSPNLSQCSEFCLLASTISFFLALRTCITSDMSWQSVPRDDL